MHGTIGRTYSEGPYQYSRAEDALIEFETDEEIAAELLPPQLRSDRGRAYVKVTRHRTSSFGPYVGVYLGLVAKYGDEPVRFMLSGLKTDWAGAVAGREIWGLPFTVGEVDLDWQGSVLRAAIRGHGGHELATFNLQTMRRAEAVGATISAKAMHSAVERDFEGNIGKRLLLTAANDFDLTGIEVWEAEATLRLGQGTPLDDWSILPVKGVIRAEYRTGGTSTLGLAKIVDTW